MLLTFLKQLLAPREKRTKEAISHASPSNSPMNETLEEAVSLDFYKRWTASGGNLHRFDHIRNFDYFENIPGWFDFQDVYNLAISQAHDGATFVEIGCFLGRSTAFLGSRIALARKKITVYGVDPWLGWENNRPSSTFADFLGNMIQAGLIDIIVPLRMMSVQAGRLFDDQSVDFCFIDGDHTYEAMSEDLRTWFPKIRNGGIIGGHDYINDLHPGVKHAVDEFFKDQVTVSGMSWHIRKTA